MMPLETSAYVKSLWWDKLNECIIWLKIMTYWKSITLFGKKSTSDVKKTFVSEPVCNLKMLKTKIKSHGDEGAGICDKKCPKIDSKTTSLEVKYLSFEAQLFFRNVPNFM